MNDDQDLEKSKQFEVPVDEETSNGRGFFRKSGSKKDEKKPANVVSLASLVRNDDFT